MNILISPLILQVALVLCSPSQIPLVAQLSQPSSCHLSEQTIQRWSEPAFDVAEAIRLSGNAHEFHLDEVKLVQVFGEDEPRYMTEAEKLRIKKSGLAFMDITDHPNLGHRNALASKQFQPLKIDVTSPKDSVLAMFDELDDEHLKTDLSGLTSFWTRSYRSPFGLASSEWVFEKVQSIISLSKTDSVTLSVSKVDHSFPQKSVLARLEATTDSLDKNKTLIILGAHQDSLNYKLPFYRAPGADDDGSGTVTLMQVLRSLVVDQFVPPEDVALEFHWYAGEEGGLRGSQDIAAQYEEQGITVKGMLQFDAVAFVKTGTKPSIGLFDQKTSPELTSFVTELIDAYLPKEYHWNMTNCGDSCGSDHMSWNKAGYRAAYACESVFEDMGGAYYHSTRDALEVYGSQFNFTHMLQFVKLGIAFVTELSIA